jgi:hypothetical protein
MRSARLGLLLVGLVASACNSSTTPSTTTTTTATTTTTTTNFVLAVAGPSVLTGLRQRSQIAATITLDDGTTQDVTKTTRWTSSNPAVAVLTASGVLTTIMPGSTQVIGTYQSTTDSFSLDVSPVATTFQGTLASSDGRNGTFTIIVGGAVAPTSTAISAPVSGSVRIPGSTINVTGFFESANGALTLSGVEVTYQFSGAVTDGVLTATFTAPDGVTGVITSVTKTQN